MDSLPEMFCSGSSILSANVKVWHATLKARLMGEREAQERCHHRLVRWVFVCEIPEAGGTANRTVTTTYSKWKDRKKAQ